MPIQKAIVLAPHQLIQHLVNEWQGKVVFSRGFVQLLVVNTHSLPGNYPGREEFILLILYYYHPSFLRNHLDWAYPTAIRDDINDTDIQQFQHFDSYYLLQVGFNLRWCSMVGL